MNKVIGFSGQKQSGKSTACKMLASLNPEIIEVSLAAKLKQVCATTFDLSLASMDSNLQKEMEFDPPIYMEDYHILSILEAYKNEIDGKEVNIRPHIGKIFYTRRQILQYVGTELLRSIDAEIHTKALYLRMQQFPEASYVISDIRFPNEFDFFKEKYGNLFECYYINNKLAELKASKDTHASELLVKETMKKCEVIENNTSLNDYENLILNKFRSLINIRS